MKNGMKSGPEQRADGAGDHAERDDEQQRELRQADDDQHQPVQQIRENRPGVWLLERVPECRETLLRVLDRPGAQDRRQKGGLVGDQIGERDAQIRESATRRR